MSDPITVFNIIKRSRIISEREKKIKVEFRETKKKTKKKKKEIKERKCGKKF